MKKAGSASNASGEADDASRRAAMERNRHLEEISQVREMLESTRAAKKEAVRELEAARSESTEAIRVSSQLRLSLEDLETEKVEVSFVLGMILAVY